MCFTSCSCVLTQLNHVQETLISQDGTVATKRHAFNYKYLDRNISSPNLMPLILFNDSSESLVIHHDNDDLIFSLPAPVSLVMYRVIVRKAKLDFKLIEPQPEFAHILLQVTIP